MIVIFIYIITQTNNTQTSNSKTENVKEYYNRHYNRRITVVSARKKAEVLAKKLKKLIELYEMYKVHIPKIKQYLEIVTDWNKLKKKICIWAGDKKLIVGLIAVINKALKETRIRSNEKLKKALESLKTLLIKLEAAVAFVSAAETVLLLFPDLLPDNVKKGMDLFKNLDKNIIVLLEQVPDFGSC